MSIGTSIVGYAGPRNGPFRCGHCKFFSREGCRQKEVIEDLGANANGLASVDANGCCNEFEPSTKGSSPLPQRS